MKYPKFLGVVLLVLAVVTSACGSSATATPGGFDTTIEPATTEPMGTASPDTDSGTGTAGIPSTGSGTGTPSSSGTTTSGTPSAGGTAGVPATGDSCATVTVQLASTVEGTTGSSGGTSSGGTTTTSTGTPATGTTSTPATGGSSGGTAATTDADDFLVDCNGMALYLNMDDTPNSGSSSCNDDCATNWPPLTISDGEEPMAGEGVDESLLSTIMRDDGTVQVTYNGWPLYLFAEDTLPGDTNGSGDGDKWFLVSADGEPIQ